MEARLPRKLPKLHVRGTLKRPSLFSSAVSRSARYNCSSSTCGPGTLVLTRWPLPPTPRLEISVRLADRHGAYLVLVPMESIVCDLPGKTYFAESCSQW